MNLYCIGEGQGPGPFAIGIAEDSKAKLAELQARTDRPLKILRDKPLSRGWDTLAETILKRTLGRTATPDGWYKITSAVATASVDKAYRATTGKENGATSNWPLIMSHIRSQIFGSSLEVMGTIAGTSASTVSRWESGELVPGIEEIKRLRTFAISHGLAWRDSLIFEPDEEGELIANDRFRGDSRKQRDARKAPKGK